MSCSSVYLATRLFSQIRYDIIYICKAYRDLVARVVYRNNFPQLSCGQRSWFASPTVIDQALSIRIRILNWPQIPFSFLPWNLQLLNRLRPLSPCSYRKSPSPRQHLRHKKGLTRELLWKSWVTLGRNISYPKWSNPTCPVIMYFVPSKRMSSNSSTSF